jgi:hypothetical protein
MTIENLAAVKEQKSEVLKRRFKRALEEQRYETAVRIALRMPDCSVCYYTSYHLDSLLALKKGGEARKLVKLLGRDLKDYILSIYGINGRDKPYKAGRRT